VKKQRGKVRPNEDLETMHDYKRDFPNHTAADWVMEALNVNNQHCSDDAITISCLLYCALDTMKLEF
jgi:hypothetical protein